MCPFHYTTVSGSGEDKVRKPYNNTSWVTLFTLTFRPKSEGKRCIIEVFVTFLFYNFGLGYWYRGLCHVIGSDLYRSLYENFIRKT